MLAVAVEPDRIRFGRDFAVGFHRTLRLPDDGRSYPLPPGLGRFAVRPVADLGDRAPASFRDQGGAFLVMHRREALWLGFEGSGRPHAVKVGVGRVNALDGRPWDEALCEGRQDYLVCPPQPWIDGIKVGDGRVRQFVAATLGRGDTVEGQVSGEERFGGIQLVVFGTRPGWFPGATPDGRGMALSPGLGIAAGGVMGQKLYPDPLGVSAWDPNGRAAVTVHILDAARYRDLTGDEPPPSPVGARASAEHGLPWVELDDGDWGDLPASDALAGVRSLRERDRDRCDACHPDTGSGDAPSTQIRTMRIPEL